MRVLAVNAGSSSLKLSLLDGRNATLAERELAPPGSPGGRTQLRRALASELGEADAVGHRIVHGGARLQAPALIDRGVEQQLRALTELAPLHQPASLAALDAVSAALPQLPAVACFDTAFHATLPAAAATYALPPAWRRRWGLRRYGFHGLSHAWVARRAPELLGRAQGRLRIVSCHLGAGASLCAIRGGRSLDTTMGFTPVEGLVMATRPGSVDPGMLTWLLERGRVSPAELADALEHRSGVLALAGSADMRRVLARAREGEQRAVLALDVYVHHLAAAVASMAASLGGLDVLVFTAGVGEHAGEIRARAAARLGFLGVRIDGRRNRGGPPDRDLAPRGAAVRTLVLHAREDREIARQVRAALS